MSSVADSKVARRYASALFNAASKLGSQSAVNTDLADLSSAWNSVPRLAQTMESPLIPAEKKIELVTKLFGSSVSETTLGFLKLLVIKRRENILPVVQHEYAGIVDAAQGVIRAKATVAAPLSEKQKGEIIEGLKKRTGKEIVMEVHVDPVIIGGVVVRMGDTIIDGSVRGSLERLREKMLQDR